MGHVDHGKQAYWTRFAERMLLRENPLVLPNTAVLQNKTIADNVIAHRYARLKLLPKCGRVGQISLILPVVAADDSVMMQTIKAIDHAKTAGCPTIVAVNK